ncbi:MAG: class I SAM-dependent methyltransferase [Bacillus sp. (in: firmicutes)]
MSRLFAKWYDFFMNPLEKKKFKKIRNELISKATGNVLELGAGTGINFLFYKKVDKVFAIEPSPYMVERSATKVKKAVVPIEIIQASAEELPFADNTFDTVVATLVFCTIPNPEKALVELKRVCKPEGSILLFEHVKMKNRLLGALQEWLTPAWKRVCDGCCLNRDTVELFQARGIQIKNMETYYSDLFIAVEGVNKN